MGRKHARALGNNARALLGELEDLIGDCDRELLDGVRGRPASFAEHRLIEANARTYLAEMKNVIAQMKALGTGPLPALEENT